MTCFELTRKGGSPKEQPGWCTAKSDAGQGAPRAKSCLRNQHKKNPLLCGFFYVGCEVFIADFNLRGLSLL